MGEKIVVGPINKGLVNNREPFFIDNDSFPTLINAYQWRGRVKRKRGTDKLTRLKRPMVSTSLGNTNGSGALSVNLISALSLQATSSIVPSSLTITVSGAPNQVFTDNGSGVLSNGGLGTGTINYATGALTIQTAPVLAAAATTITFAYYPSLPVMGLEDFLSPLDQFPGTLAFDTVYSYVINTTTPYLSYANNYYKNLATATYAGYVAKTTWTALTWNGQDYQQFWTRNYQGSMWTTNGIEVPFDITNVGMQFKPIVTTTIVAAGPPARVTLQITGHGLVVGDFVFVNEVASTTGINYQTGFVDTVTDPNNVIVQFPTSTVATNGTGGIAQYLTNRSDVTKDCIRWYDGSPVSSATPPVFSGSLGWVNFCPPLTDTATSTFSIGDLPPGQYYLVGARAILPYKDRLLFFGPVVQTSSAGSQRYLQDTVIYSQNGTPYYTTTFPYSTVVPTVPVLVTANFTSILVPANQTAYPMAFWENVTGYGGFIQAGYDEPINTVTANEDVVILGFSESHARLVYTGNDLLPFVFYVINSEYGSSSTFSAINFDKGAISIGLNGIVIASQNEIERIDLQIPDEVFQINLITNGIQRVSAQRDFINEWVYFTYSSHNDNATNYFPNQTLFFNYRDNSWAIFKENYTTYGTFRRTSGETWGSLDYFTWGEWTDWESGENNLAQPEVIGGNQQGYVMVKSEGIGEDPSGYIASIDSNSLVTSTNHGLNNADYIIISGCIGTIGTYVNGRIFSVANPDANTFTLNPTVPTGTYLGGGEFTRLSVPVIQTKQFPVSWGMSRKTRIGVQQYLFSTTSEGQITLQIFLSQNGANPYNTSDNDSLIYTDILYTCPESTNLGLTPANINLQMPTAMQQKQIWHRMNSSLIGDTVQIGFTLSDDQMRSLIPVSDALEITGATAANPCVLTCANALGIGQLVSIADVGGMTELNGNIYIITSRSDTTLTLQVDASGFTTYTSGGTATCVAPIYQESEIEFHSFILDVSPSGMLA